MNLQTDWRSSANLGWPQLGSSGLPSWRPAGWLEWLCCSCVHSRVPMEGKDTWEDSSSWWKKRYKRSNGNFTWPHKVRVKKGSDDPWQGCKCYRKWGIKVSKSNYHKHPYPRTPESLIQLQHEAWSRSVSLLIQRPYELKENSYPSSSSHSHPRNPI